MDQIWAEVFNIDEDGFDYEYECPHCGEIVSGTFCFDLDEDEEIPMGMFAFETPCTECGISLIISCSL